MSRGKNFSIHFSLLPFLPCFSQEEAQMRPRRCEPARFLDARPLYFRPGLESASNSIILVSRIPLLSAYPQPSCGSVVYSYEARRRGRQTDRSPHFTIKGQRSPRASCSKKRKGGECRVERGFYDRRMIYRSFEYRTSNWRYSYKPISRDNSLVSISTKY